MAARDVHIIGGGSLGLLYAHQARSQRIPTTLILRDKHVSRRVTSVEKAMITVERGFTAPREVTRVDCRVEYIHMPSASSPSAGAEPHDGSSPAPEGVAAQGPPITTLLVATKAMDVVPAVRSVQHRLAQDSALMLTQNGILRVYEELWREVLRTMSTPPRIIIANTTHGCYCTGPLSACHAGLGAIGMAEVDPALHTLRDPGHQRMWERGPSQPFLMLLSWLRGLNAEQVPSHTQLLRQLIGKLAVNCAVNPTTALLGCLNGHLAKEPHAQHLMASVCQEVHSVFSEELGGTVTDLYDTVHAVALRTGRNRSSMLQSMTNGRYTEIDYLNGYVVEMGREKQISTPVCATLQQLIKSKEALTLGRQVAGLAEAEA